MRPELLPRNILFDEEAHDKIARGAELMYKTAKTSYGPKAGNIMYEHNWPVGGAKISRDGVTNLRKVADKDRTANMTCKVILQASEKNNAVAGDGTTAVAILAYHFYTEGRKLVAAGHNRMEVSEKIEETAEKAIEYIDSIKKELEPGDLLSVARVACGNEGIAELLAKTVEEVGSEGGVTVEEHAGLGVYGEVIDGFYMRKGFTDVGLVKDKGSLSSDFENVPILLLDKTISEAKEMAVIINKVRGAGHTELLILGEVMHDALDFLNKQRSGDVIIPTLSAIPATAGMKSIVLDDLSVLTGGRVFQHGQSATDFDVSYLGAAERALVDELSTTIIGGAGDEKVISERLGELQKQLLEENHPTTINALKDRISRLKGKVGIVKVGAPTDVDREELRLRVDDAVCALQAARREGIVPGGGTALARVTGTPFDNVLTKPFIELLHNAGENAELKLGKTLESPVDYGYNLKEPTVEPINLREAGIIDPALVIKEVVRNAASVSSALIKVGGTNAYADELFEVKK